MTTKVAATVATTEMTKGGVGTVAARRSEDDEKNGGSSGGGSNGTDRSPQRNSTDLDTLKQPSTIMVGKTKCLLIGDEQFSKLRRLDGVPSDFLTDFDFDKMGGGGGKGGSKLGFSKCDGFIVKEITGSDDTALRDMTRRLVDHVLTMTKKKRMSMVPGAPLSDGRTSPPTVVTETSFISRIYAHFTIPKSGRCFIAIASVIPDIRNKHWDEVYDLKGCRDDKLIIKAGKRVREVHMRCWRMPYFCCLSLFGALPQQRKSYYDGKKRAYEGNFLHSTKESRRLILQALKKDTTFFAREGVMDYSLVVGIRRCPLASYEPGVTFPPGVNGHNDQPYIAVHNDTVVAYYIGIIDFLQKWLWTKKVAACLKCCCAPKPLSTVPPDAYARQFYRHFEEKLTQRPAAQSLRDATEGLGKEEEEEKEEVPAPPSASPSPTRF